MKILTSYSRNLLTALFLVLFSLNIMAQETTSNKTHEISNEDLKAYVGQYTYDNKAEQGFDITVSSDGAAKLMAQPTNKSQPLAMLSAMAKDEFELLKTGGLIVTFKRDKKGKILSLTISQGSQSFTCIRKEE